MDGKRRKTFLLPVLGIAFLGVFLPAFLAGQTDEQTDPFYANLLEEGKFFYQNGKPAEAIENLEIAFFGFLDSPAKLAECYIYLTVCHFQQRNAGKFTYYFNEIKRLKLEDRIPALNLPKELAEKYAEITAKLEKPAGTVQTGKAAKRR